MAASHQDPLNQMGNQPSMCPEQSASAPRTASPSSPSTPTNDPRGPRRGWIAAALIVLVVLVAVGFTVPSGAPAHRLWLAPAGAVAQPQADPQVAAIQVLIQQANDEQTQALAGDDASLMSDTGTAAYYRQLVQANQDLTAQGVTSIKLTQLNWGPVAINGSTATATTSETWITTFSDGTTIESEDTNVYTLVQQGGRWLIDADQHAVSTAAQATSRSGGQGPTPAQPTPQASLPGVPVGQHTSHNWSGYVATAGRYTGVTGTWTMPQPRLSGAGGVGATWVGIGGVTSHDLIQAGTQEVATGGGQAQFQTWIEMLPQASHQVPLAVVPGDSMTVSIEEQGAGTGIWQISLKNNTSGQTYQTTVEYASSESSAEWVEEAPASSGGILPLDHFSSVSFSAASAIQNGETVNLAQAGAQPITILNARNRPLAESSPIGSDGSSFTVRRTSAPATTGSGSLGRGPGGAQPGVGHQGP
jgi:hypothetical protein